MELLSYIGAGLLGGLILNVMPCVLPVLTMKVFHLVEHSGQGTPARVRHLHGLAYTGGVLAAFFTLAAIVLIAKASGQRVGWGMQFQNPEFVAVMTALVFVFGLNALGVFEFTVSMSGRPGHQGYSGSFFNGIFAAIMSTPCSAPFLGTAAAFALGSAAAWYDTVAMFAAIGFGLASPFLLVSLVPAIGRKLPRPGPWMETFKHLMGFSLLGAAVWLYRSFQAQVSRDSANDLLVFLLVLAVALWGVHRFGSVIHSTGRRLGVRAAALVLVGLTAHSFVTFEPPEARAAAPVDVAAGDDTVVKDGKIVWTPFDPKTLAAAHGKQRPVFVDYTADWCANCKTNERVFLETDAVRTALSKTGVLPMKADLTNEDETIQGYLDKLGRSGIPAYAIYLPDGGIDLLPEAITSELVVERLRKAAEKFPPRMASR